MDIEELNKTQIILLTLLVSFITSIATGIVTVSLMNQAPKVVTDTVHKVIEKTVERVVPGEQKATIIKNTETIIVSDQDFVIKAIEKNSNSLVRVFSSVKDKEGKDQIDFVSLGVICSEQGGILVDGKNLSKEGNYFINDNELNLKLTFVDSLMDNSLLLFKVQLPDSKILGEKKLVFVPIEFGDSDVLKLGQSIVSLGGEVSNIALTGIISNLKRDKFSISPSTEKQLETQAETKIMTTEIETSLSSQLPVSLLIDLDGKIIGIKSSASFFIPINLVKRDLDKHSQTNLEIKTVNSN